MIVPRQIRAPRRHGEVLADPPAEGYGRLLANNQQLIQQYSLDLLGRPFAELRDEARRAALALANDYLRRRGESTPASRGTPQSPLLLSGHQPELFHPGVWVKNFAVNGLARRHGGTAVNLVIDTDSAKPPSLHLPGWESAEPIPACDPAEIVRLALPYDRWTRDVPYEGRPVLDEDLFGSLPVRVAPYVRGWGFKPVLPEFWAEALNASRRNDLLGERLAAARRTFERRWGCANWEVPMSQLCESEPFAWFACHLLAHLPRFHATYNACVREYRRANGVRSSTRPVPDLAADGDWLEVPFWAWPGGRGRRGRLFARAGQGAVTLRVNDTAGPTLPLAPAADARRAVTAWAEAQAGGFKIRSRALTTTLFARLFVADVFTHGIGGGKYDEITDEIIHRFYGLEPPGFQVMSATLLMPFPSYPADPDDCRRLAVEVRDLFWNPQRHVPPSRAADPPVARLLGERADWVARRPTETASRAERFRQMRRLTEELRRMINGRPLELKETYRVCERQVAANAVLRRRDYAFCLYPEDLLKSFLAAFL